MTAYSFHIVEFSKQLFSNCLAYFTFWLWYLYFFFLCLSQFFFISFLILIALCVIKPGFSINHLNTFYCRLLLGFSWNQWLLRPCSSVLLNCNQNLCPSVFGDRVFLAPGPLHTSHVNTNKPGLLLGRVIFWAFIENKSEEKGNDPWTRWDSAGIQIPGWAHWLSWKHSWFYRVGKWPTLLNMWNVTTARPFSHPAAQIMPVGL